MAASRYSFQYCPKLAVFNADRSRVLLCRRRAESDFDGVFSFIGGKMETSDGSILAALRREKDEEVGAEFTVEVLPLFSIDTTYTKNDGSSMILPHYYARHLEGPISLNREYSEYRWVPLEDLASFEPKIFNILLIAEQLSALANMVSSNHFQVL